MPSSHANTPLVLFPKNLDNLLPKDLDEIFYSLLQGHHVGIKIYPMSVLIARLWMPSEKIYIILCSLREDNHKAAAATADATFAKDNWSLYNLREAVSRAVAKRKLTELPNNQSNLVSQEMYSDNVIEEEHTIPLSFGISPPERNRQGITATIVALKMLSTKSLDGRISWPGGSTTYYWPPKMRINGMLFYLQEAERRDLFLQAIYVWHLYEKRLEEESETIERAFNGVFKEGTEPFDLGLDKYFPPDVFDTKTLAESIVEIIELSDWQLVNTYLLVGWELLDVQRMSNESHKTPEQFFRYALGWPARLGANSVYYPDL